VHNKLFAAAFFTDDPNKVDHLWVRILIINTKSAFDRHWNFNVFSHLSHDLRDKFRIKHQYSTKTAIFSLLTRAATVDIDLIVAPLLYNLRCLRHLARIVTSELKYDRMLVGCVG